MKCLIAFLGGGSFLLGIAWVAMSGSEHGSVGAASAIASPATAPTRGPQAGTRPSYQPKGPLKKAILLIPLTYNDGRRVPPEVLEGIYQQLFVVSGGYTLVGTVKGAYRMSDGTQQTDVLEQVWVACSAADRPRLRRLAAQFCLLLAQESLYLEFTDSVIELTPPGHEESGSERGGTP